MAHVVDGEYLIQHLSLLAMAVTYITPDFCRLLSHDKTRLLRTFHGYETRSKQNMVASIIMMIIRPPNHASKISDGTYSRTAGGSSYECESFVVIYCKALGSNTKRKSFYRVTISDGWSA